MLTLAWIAGNAMVFVLIGVVRAHYLKINTKSEIWHLDAFSRATVKCKWSKLHRRTPRYDLKKKNRRTENVWLGPWANLNS